MREDHPPPPQSAIEQAQRQAAEIIAVEHAAALRLAESIDSLTDEMTEGEQLLEPGFSAVTLAYVAYRGELERAAARLRWASEPAARRPSEPPPRPRRVVIALSAAYWLAVLAVSLVVVIVAVLFLESRDLSSLSDP